MRLPPLRKFLALPSSKRRIFGKAFFLLIFIRLGMWLVPYRTLQKALGRLFPSPAATGQSQSPEKIALAKKISSTIKAVRWYVPSATCLAQALTLQALLSREGIPSDLAIGVAHGDETGIAAHAWLEIDGTVVIGGEERNRYTRLKMQE